LLGLPGTPARGNPKEPKSTGVNADQLYRRALKAYENGQWNEVLDLLSPTPKPTDEMRALLAAARWQIALARLNSRQSVKSASPSTAKQSKTQNTPGRSHQALNGLIVANLMIYAVILFIVYFIWQHGSLALPPLPGMPVQASTEDSLLLQAESAMRTEDWDTAISAFRRYLDQHPDQVEVQTKLAYVTEQRRRAALFTQAIGYYERKRPDQALETFRRLQATAPDYKPQVVTSYVCKSVVQQVRNQVATAQTAVEQLLPLRATLSLSLSECQDDPAFGQARRMLDLYIAGLEASELKHWEDARNFWRELYAADPNYAGGLIAHQLYRAYAAVGLIHFGQSKWPAALEEFNQALSLGVPDSLGVTRYRAQALAQAIPTVTPTLTASPTAPTTGDTPD